MPRLTQVSRTNASSEVLTAYNAVFGDRDPVSDPGTATGTRGDWWTTMALVPDILKSLSEQLQMIASPRRQLPAQLRELANVRAGFVRGSQFVFSQHSKLARAVGVSPDHLAGIPSWAVADVFTPRERAVLAYVDEVILQNGRVQDATVATLKEHLGDAEILELTVSALVYDLHAVLTRALRLEYDDIEERVTEVPAPAGFSEQSLLVLAGGTDDPE